MKKTFFLIPLFCMFLQACEKPVNPGQIAFVNDVPLTLKQLQAVRDSLALGEEFQEKGGNEYSAMQEEYGPFLAELITQEIVTQEMDRLHQGVSDEELSAEEALIRSDFPGEEFERMLMEESVDLDIWRENLRRHLAVQKFQSTVLREYITLSAQEVESYYLEHQESFRVPDFIHFIQFSGLVRDQIVLACEQYRQMPDSSAIQTRFPNLAIHEINMPADRLAPEQLSGLEGLGLLQVSPILEMNGELFAMVLLGREKARSMTRTETYALIEGILLEEKTRNEFGKWLDERLGRSKIRISIRLVPENLRK
ncbi:MAG: hypothetical protein FWG17_05705 [Desulfovibrionaceae bacterium]|nr:hypothetical protein [Desulfovibrionaceae bacterium]